MDRTISVPVWKRVAACLAAGVAMSLALSNAYAQDVTGSSALRGAMEETLYKSKSAASVSATGPLTSSTQSGGLDYQPVGSISDGNTLADAEPLVIEAESVDLDPVSTAISNAEIPEPPTYGAVEPIGAVQGGVAASDENPYAAQGIQLGSFTLKPSIEIGATANRSTSTSAVYGPPLSYVTSTTNAYGLAASGTVEFESDWSRHSLDGSVSASKPLDLSGNGDATPDFKAEAALRLDMAQGHGLTFTGNYSAAFDDPLSANVANALALDPALEVADDPLLQTFGGSVQYNGSAGLVSTQVQALASRELRGDVKMSDGTSISQSETAASLYGLRLRLGANTGAIIQPFVEGAYTARRYDSAVDANGIARDWDSWEARAGATIDFGEKLNGEISAGYILTDIKEASLEDIRALSLAADLTWSPQRNTDIGLTVSTTTVPSGDAAQSGSLVYAANVDVTHRPRINWELTAGAGIEHEKIFGAGSDTTTLNGQVGATYWFNRFVGLTGRLGYERALSEDQTQRSSAATAFMGVKLQR